VRDAELKKLHTYYPVRFGARLTCFSRLLAEAAEKLALIGVQIAGSA
jgi:hypothetical protein